MNKKEKQEKKEKTEEGFIGKDEEILNEKEEEELKERLKYYGYL